ncbi:MAG: hypothetical protein J1F17_06890 [Oscillospiraceae bacterium]|nr:hypothetical protein [Oscillospiraceae bacterium]
MLEAITTVWTALMTWFTGIFPEITKFFYTPAASGSGAGTLTFAGVMAVVMAGVALILLVFNLIRSFLPMRG